MENLIVAISNLIAILPIVSAYQKSDYLTTVCLSLAMLFSIIYHLAETEKHQLPGLFGKQFGRKYHFILINLDRISAVLAILRVIYKYYHLDETIISWSVIGLASLLISEIKKNSYYIYLPYHCLWHIVAFSVANYLINLKMI